MDSRPSLRVRPLLASVLVVMGCAGPRPAPTPEGGRAFDLQSHRGARGLRPENTLPAFAHSLELGITTIELDVVLSADGVVVVTHERRVNPLMCTDTRAAQAGDPAFPYVGKRVIELTLAQLQTLDCGRRNPPDRARDEFLPTLTEVPGARMPTLAQAFALVRDSKADRVRFNVELKSDPTHPDETPEPEAFVAAVLAVVQEYDLASRVLIQSFDWRVLRAAQKLAPSVARSALIHPKTGEPGKPGASPWLAGLDLDSEPFLGDPAAAASAAGANVLAPAYQLVTKALVESAHRHGLRLIPWTVNEKPEMRELIALGVDGIITDYPDRLREVMQERGMALPRGYRVER